MNMLNVAQTRVNLESLKLVERVHLYLHINISLHSNASSGVVLFEPPSWLSEPPLTTSGMASVCSLCLLLFMQYTRISCMKTGPE